MNALVPGVRFAMAWRRGAIRCPAPVAVASGADFPFDAQEKVLIPLGPTRMALAGGSRMIPE